MAMSEEQDMPEAGQDDTPVSTHSQLRKILSNHRGRENAITSTELAAQIGINDANGNPTTRFEILSLIRLSGMPIGSCPNGYYIIETSDELREYLDRLDHRIAGIERRKQLVREAYQNHQQTLHEVLTQEGDTDE